MIPPVVASERGRVQTCVVATPRRGCRTTLWYGNGEWNCLERQTIAGESPLHESCSGLVVS